MSLSDVFVFLDDVEINTRSYTRRVKIRHQATKESHQWLTVPLTAYPEKAKIHELNIDQSKQWVQRHMGIIQNTYVHAENFSRYKEWLTNLFAQCSDFTQLSEMNIYLVQQIAEKLQIKCRFLRSSELPVFGKADTYTYNIVKHLEGRAYMRGKGEQRYAQNPKWQTDPEIEVVNINYDKFIQNDNTGSWKNGYSIIDLLMTTETTPTLS